MAVLESALEELYSSDPSEFTKKRDALAKELKKAGDKEGAAAVSARRKPTQIAWVLNQLARKHPDAIAELVDVGRELAREQRRALRGETSHGLRDQIDRQRKAITELAKKTTLLMKELGVDPSGYLEEVSSALQAALIDPVVGAQLEEGRLEKAPEAAVGFGGALPAEPAADEAPKRHDHAKHDHAKHDHAKDDAHAKHETQAKEKEKREREKEEKAAEERAARRVKHAKELAEAKAVLKAAEAASTKARRGAERAEREATAAIEQAKKLAEEARESEAITEASQKEVTRLTANSPE